MPTAAAEFEGLTALVTGGASGIGLATAQLLTARGARVAILDRDIPWLTDAPAGREGGVAGGADGGVAGGADGGVAGGAGDGRGGLGDGAPVGGPNCSGARHEPCSCRDMRVKRDSTCR